jgi:hypothetical protein
MSRKSAVLFLLLLLAAAIGVLKLIEPRKEVPLTSVSVSEKKKEGKKEEAKEVVKKKVVKRDAEGWLPYLTIGRNPYAKFRTPEKDRKILTKRGYTKEEVDEYLDLREKGKGIYMAFFKGENFLWVVFGDARVIEKLRAVWNVPQPGTLYQLKSGRNVVVLDECENLAEVPPRPILEVLPVVAPPPTPEAPPVVEVPTPPTPEAPLVIEVPPVAELPVAEKKEEVGCLNSFKKWDPNLFVGHEREPRHNGNSMEATDLSAALYCLWQTDDPSVIHGLGLNFKGSWFEGRVNHGAGKFTGYLLAGGPAYKRVVKDKWDMEVRLLFGVLHERFRQDGYRNHRDNLVVGPSFIFNDYRRRSEGYRWFHETQWYIELLFPFASELSQSFDGKPLAGDPDNLNVRLFVGFKEWLYDNKWAQPYFQAGIFWEDPLAASATLRLGVAVPGRWFGVGLGPDFDLKNGGTVLGWGPWLDIRTAVDVWRVNHRAGQMTDVTGIGGGVTVSPDGFIMVPFGEGNADVSSSGQPSNSGLQNGNAVDPPDRSLTE